MSTNKIKSFQRILTRIKILVVCLAFISPISTAASPTKSSNLTSWEEFEQQLSTLGSETGFLAAEIVKDQCQPIHALNPEVSLAIASSFKLYILGELARQVKTQMVSWNEPLTIQEEFKSVPHGDLRFVAEKMIQESDNTATDHHNCSSGKEKYRGHYDGNGQQ